MNTLESIIYSLSFTSGWLGMSSGDISYICTAQSCNRICYLSLRLEIGSINVISLETQFLEPQNQPRKPYNPIHLIITLSTQIRSSHGPKEKQICV